MQWSLGRNPNNLGPHAHGEEDRAVGGDHTPIGEREDQMRVAVEVHMRPNTNGNETLSKSQVAGISKPLWSVGRICDASYEMRSNKDGADIFDAISSKLVARFARKQGLYVGAMELRNPEASTFARTSR